MTCFHPISAFRGSVSKTTGLRSVVFKAPDGDTSSAFQIPCGQCLGCRLDRAQQWTSRIMHEASLHDESLFLTLTYNDKNIPSNFSLNKRDITLFLKSLRKHYQDIALLRFYQVGEYGKNPGFDFVRLPGEQSLKAERRKSRPHHHVALFVKYLDGVLSQVFDDRILIREREPVLYASNNLERIWHRGLCSIGEITLDSAAYIAKYVTKKITGEKADYHYAGKQPEFSTMSRKPGIGREWFNKYHNDIKGIDGVLFKGFRLKPPRYYDNLYDNVDPENLKLRKEKRLENVKQYTAPELERKERYLKEKFKTFNQRKLEK